MKKLPVALTAVALVLFSASAGFAQQKGGVKINGVATNTTVSTGPAGPLVLNDEQMDNVTAGSLAAAAAAFVAGYVATKVLDAATAPDVYLFDGPRVKQAQGQPPH
jgi:hypothetical protein